MWGIPGGRILYAESGQITMNNTEQPVSSPCISICALNEDDVCIGCYRSAGEIREWVAMDNSERKIVLQRSALRARQVNPFAQG